MSPAACRVCPQGAGAHRRACRAGKTAVCGNPFVHVLRGTPMNTVGDTRRGHKLNYPGLANRTKEMSDAFPRVCHLLPWHRHPTGHSPIAPHWKDRACFVPHSTHCKSQFALRRRLCPDALTPECLALRVRQSCTCLTRIVEGSSDSPGGPCNETQGVPGLLLASALPRSWIVTSHTAWVLNASRPAHPVLGEGTALCGLLLCSVEEFQVRGPRTLGAPRTNSDCRIPVETSRCSSR